LRTCSCTFTAKGRALTDALEWKHHALVQGRPAFAQQTDLRQLLPQVLNHQVQLPQQLQPARQQQQRQAQRQPQAPRQLLPEKRRPVPCLPVDATFLVKLGATRLTLGLPQIGVMLNQEIVKPATASGVLLKIKTHAGCSSKIEMFDVYFFFYHLETVWKTSSQDRSCFIFPFHEGRLL